MLLWHAPAYCLPYNSARIDQLLVLAGGSVPWFMLNHEYIWIEFRICSDPIDTTLNDPFCRNAKFTKEMFWKNGETLKADNIYLTYKYFRKKAKNSSILFPKQRKVPTFPFYGSLHLTPIRLTSTKRMRILQFHPENWHKKVDFLLFSTTKPFWWRILSSVENCFVIA